jgi:hypothetical protein
MFELFVLTLYCQSETPFTSKEATEYGGTLPSVPSKSSVLRATVSHCATNIVWVTSENPQSKVCCGWRGWDWAAQKEMRKGRRKRRAWSRATI